MSIRAFQPACESLTRGQRRDRRTRRDDTAARRRFVRGRTAGHARRTPLSLRRAHAYRATTSRFTTPTPSPCKSPTTTSTCSGRDACCKATTSSARTSARSTASRACSFAVWAPNAFRVSVIGDFNSWDAASTRCRYTATAASGSCSSPTSRRARSTATRFARTTWAIAAKKAIPMASTSRCAPRTPRLSTTSTSYTWGDADWLDARAHRDPLKQPWSMYEVHLGSWQRDENGNWLTYRELADKAGRLRQRHGLHPPRTDADHRVSVRWLVGLSGDRLLRADQPLRQARTISCTSSITAIRTASA